MIRRSFFRMLLALPVVGPKLAAREAAKEAKIRTIYASVAKYTSFTCYGTAYIQGDLYAEILKGKIFDITPEDESSGMYHLLRRKPPESHD